MKLKRDVLSPKENPSFSSALKSNICRCEQMSRRDKSPGKSGNQANRGSRNYAHQSNSGPFGCIQPGTSSWIHGSEDLHIFQRPVAAEEAGRWGEIQDFKRVGAATAGEQSEREQQQEGKEWFRQDLTVCFSVWCIKSR